MKSVTLRLRYLSNLTSVAFTTGVDITISELKSAILGDPEICRLLELDPQTPKSLLRVCVQQKPIDPRSLVAQLPISQNDIVDLVTI